MDPMPHWMPRAALVVLLSPSIVPVVVYAGFAATHLM